MDIIANKRRISVGSFRKVWRGVLRGCWIVFEGFSEGFLAPLEFWNLLMENELLTDFHSFVRKMEIFGNWHFSPV